MITEEIFDNYKKIMLLKGMQHVIENIGGGLCRAYGLMTAKKIPEPGVIVEMMINEIPEIEKFRPKDKKWYEYWFKSKSIKASRRKRILIIQAIIFDLELKK